LWAKLIAASVALLILTWIGRNYMYPSDGTPLLTEQQAANGQQLTIKLTDGTVIQLNAGSTLIYPDKFLADKREVRLKGEAYFEVAPDATAPFLIYTDDVRVKVIGTKFTVKAYPESKDVKVAVVEGMVAVNLTVVKGKKEIVETTEANLIKDEMATIVKKDQQLKISAFDKNDLLGWKNGILYFEKASFPQIVEQLERWYGVKVTVQARIEMDSAWRFSGKFENKSIDYILDVCSYPNQFKYEIIDNEVIIK
jgi:ferric-dicitrate binding protein FerR (iron transport regulator)